MKSMSVEVVVDANVVINRVVATMPFHAQAVRLLDDLATNNVQLVAPAYFPAEVDSAIRMAVVHKAIRASDAPAFHAALDALPVLIVYDSALRVLARQLGDRLGAPRVYDATYVALAQLHSCDLWTADKRLWNGAQNAGIGWVKFLGDY